MGASGLLCDVMLRTDGREEPRWVAAVPTTVLVAIAPVDGIVKHTKDTPLGSIPDHRVLWLQVNSPLVGELYRRIDRGEFQTWQTQYFFDRVSRSHAEFAEYILHTRDVWASGADVVVHDAGMYLAPYGVIDESRTRIVGSRAGEWRDHDVCVRGLEDGRYRIEREFFWSGPRGEYPPREQWKPLWRTSREFRVERGTPSDMRGYNSPKIKRIVDEWPAFDLAVVGNGEPYLFSYFLSNWPRLEHASGSLAVGFELEAWRDGELVITGRIHPPNPIVWDLSNHVSHQAYRLDRLKPLHPGDRLTVRLTGTERAASFDVERIVYWNGVIEFDVESLDMATRVVRGWTGLGHERAWYPPVAPMKD